MDFLKNLNSLFNLKTENNKQKANARKLPTAKNDLEQLLVDVIEEALKVSPDQPYWFQIKLSDLKAYATIKKQNPSIKRELVLKLIDEINAYKKKTNRNNTSNRIDHAYFIESAYSDMLSALMRSNLDYSTPEIIAVFNAYKKSSSSNIRIFADWPIGFSVLQIERIVKKDGLTQEMKSFLEAFLKWPEIDRGKNYWGSDLEKVRIKVKKILIQDNLEEGKVLPYRLPDDQFGNMVNHAVDSLDDDSKDTMYELFHLFIKSNSSKPSKRYLKESGALIDTIGISKYKTIIQPWLEFVCALKEIETVHEQVYNGQTYYHNSYQFLHEKSSSLLKGLVWSLAKFHDSKTLNLVAQLAERAFKKIPGVGPAAAAVGNACIYVLGNTKGLEGISHLSRLKLKIKQNNTKKLIIKYLEEASEKLGVSSSEIEELSIPDFGLILGKKQYKFDNYQLNIEIQELGKVALNWIKPDGSIQKSAPSFIKDSNNLKAQLKKAKTEVANIKKYLTAQRDRIDRCYLENRIWTYDNLYKYYIAHGLVSFIAQKLIWQFKQHETFVSAYFKKNVWYTIDDQPLDWIDDTTEVRLWHPIYTSTKNTLKWRTKFEELQVKQPMKQAYREVYILTDAEINTKTYSNRMAAHIIKQHQFNALTAIRGWRYTLMGAFDNGVDAEIASIQIKAHHIEAQFWINEIQSDDAFNDSGIWNYIATDQVRFVKQGEAMDLIDVPKLVFTEIMRDVDLFVGVCSVGNDPEWRDNGGLPQYNDYWASYSFGDLTELAKTRKDILEKLLPRLKINKVSSIDGKFLKVKGSKRNYKIHIGSTNILMEPNDQYLCIVPARGKDKNTENIFLPFEGDRGLSLVLSKAFLLAADDKITDSTILSQINRN